MGHPWKHLRGEELSAYAASIHAADQWGNFAKHLAAHGKVEDFHRFVERDCKPVEKCLEVFSSHPVAALDWIKKYLQTPQSDTHNMSQSHFFVGKFVCDHMAYFGNRTTANTIFDHINFEGLQNTHKIQLFKPLVSSGMQHIVERNWELYQPLFQNMNDKVADYVVFGAFFGFSFKHRINWRPSYYKHKEDLFVACCVGGLMDTAKEMQLPNTKHNVILDAFLRTLHPPGSRAKNFKSVLKCLWESYPETPWHTDERILSTVLHAPPQLSEKIIDYFHRHAPGTVEKRAGSIACKAIERKNLRLLNLITPFISIKALPEVIYFTVGEHNESIIEVLIELPEGDKVFKDSLIF